MIASCLFVLWNHVSSKMALSRALKHLQDPAKIAPNKRPCICFWDQFRPEKMKAYRLFNTFSSGTSQGSDLKCKAAVKIVFSRRSLLPSMATIR